MEKVIAIVTVKDIGRGDEIWSDLQWFGPEVTDIEVNDKGEFTYRTVNGGRGNLGIDLNRTVIVRRYP